jgi:hypothetical protein
MRRFVFRLALALGRTVAELERSLSSAELTEWAGYSLLEPFGQQRADDGQRGIMALLYNANRAPKAKAVEPSDFMAVWRPQETIDAEAAAERLRAWLDRMVERGGDDG